MGLKDYPTGAESLKVKEEIKIIGKQSALTFTFHRKNTDAGSGRNKKK